MRILLLLPFLFLFSNSNAQYTTPNTGVKWNLDSLVLHSDGAIVLLEEYKYQITEDITLAENDSLNILYPDPWVQADSVFVDADKIIYIEGHFYLDYLNISFNATDIENPYGGFRFESTSSAYIYGAHFKYGGGIKVLTGDFFLGQATLQYFTSGVNTGAALEVSTGSPEIFSNFFWDNELAAISSAANAEVSPTILGNWIERNNYGNTNRPQINLGPSGANDTTKIFFNWVNGDTSNTMAGGIAVSSLLGIESNVFISGNHVEDNRYGIAIIGSNISATVIGNTCLNNNIQGDPMLGGSGINFNSTSATSSAIVRDNSISGNLWGITVQGEFEVNMGDDSEESPGLNIFYENGNGGETYALYNNTPNPISALNNCWDGLQSITLAEAEDVIFHQEDDASLGLVSFDPMWNCGADVGIDELDEALFSIYPNPAINEIVIKSDTQVDEFKIYTITGQLIKSGIIRMESPTRINISDLESGLYMIELFVKNKAFTQPFIKQ